MVQEAECEGIHLVQSIAGDRQIGVNISMEGQWFLATWGRLLLEADPVKLSIPDIPAYVLATKFSCQRPEAKKVWIII